MRAQRLADVLLQELDHALDGAGDRILSFHVARQRTASAFGASAKAVQSVPQFRDVDYAIEVVKSTVKRFKVVKKTAVRVDEALT